MANYFIIVSEYNPCVGYSTKVIYASSTSDAFIKYRWYSQFERDRGIHYYKVSKPCPDPEKYVVRIKPHVYHNGEPRQTGLYGDLPF